MAKKKTKAELAADAARILETLKVSRYLTFDYKSGLNVFADDHEVGFSVNIAQVGPTDDEVSLGLLLDIERYFHQLMEVSPELREFVGVRKFCAYLEVNSGPMSFIHAKLVDGKLVK